ncbi:MAG: hypothetical protein NTZ16_12670 [Verrucomicrobia bacterium]|nr:hypothetical protein [Verrucomicrobiota bacterium]
MNSGFSNLTELKAHLLPSAMRSGIAFDTAIAAIGLGVVTAFEQYCNRKFQRTVAATMVCTADRDHCYLDRYPVEALTKTELKADINVGWEQQDGLVLNMNEASGLVYWGAGISFAWAQLRFTFTGGFFWNTLEPADQGYPAALPNGAAALPADLKLAWLMQCEAIWANRDKLGASVADEPEKHSKISKVEFTPLVIETLNNYRRMQLT